MHFHKIPLGMSGISDGFEPGGYDETKLTIKIPLGMSGISDGF
jgi:hypothetical protein